MTRDLPPPMPPSTHWSSVRARSEALRTTALSKAEESGTEAAKPAYLHLNPGQAVGSGQTPGLRSGARRSQQEPDSQPSPVPWRRDPERPRVAQRLPSTAHVALVSWARGGPSGVRSRVTWWPGPRSALLAENSAARYLETQLRGTRGCPVRGPCGLRSPRPFTGATTSPGCRRWPEGAELGGNWALLQRRRHRL